MYTDSCKLTVHRQLSVQLSNLDDGTIYIATYISLPHSLPQFQALQPERTNCSAVLVKVYHVMQNEQESSTMPYLMKR